MMPVIVALRIFQTSCLQTSGGGQTRNRGPTSVLSFFHEVCQLFVTDFESI